MSTFSRMSVLAFILALNAGESLAQAPTLSPGLREVAKERDTVIYQRYQSEINGAKSEEERRGIQEKYQSILDPEAPWNNPNIPPEQRMKSAETYIQTSQEKIKSVLEMEPGIKNIPQHSDGFQEGIKPQHSGGIQGDSKPQHSGGFMDRNTPQHSGGFREVGGKKVIDYNAEGPTGPQHSGGIQGDNKPQHSGGFYEKKSPQNSGGVRKFIPPQHSDGFINKKQKQLFNGDSDHMGKPQYSGGIYEYEKQQESMPKMDYWQNGSSDKKE